jgi:hypothetical protein
MIDASIPLQVRPPQIAGPMDMAANALAIQGGVQKNALVQMQMQQAQRQMADDQGLREVLSSPDLTMDQAPNALLRRGLYKPAMEMEKALLEKRKSLATIGKDEAETNLKHLGVLSGIMAGAKTPEDFANGLKTAQAAGVPSQLIQQFAANAPQNALQIPSYAQNIAAITKQGIDAMKFRLGDFKDTGGALVDMNPYSPTFQQAMPKTATPGEVLTDTRGKATLEEQKRHNRQTEGIQGGQLAVSRETLAQGGRTYDADRGVVVNTRTGAATPVTQGGQPLQTGAKLTEAQGKATGLSMRAREAADILNQLESSGTFGRVEGKVEAARQGLERIPVIGTAAGNVVAGAGNSVISGEQQKYAQAKRDFVNAVLRVESGATITGQEFDNADRQYFPQTGDSKTVIEQKRKNREKAIEALSAQAGPGATRIPRAKTPGTMSDDELKKALGL